MNVSPVKNRRATATCSRGSVLSADLPVSFCFSLSLGLPCTVVVVKALAKESQFLAWSMIMGVIHMEGRVVVEVLVDSVSVVYGTLITVVTLRKL